MVQFLLQCKSNFMNILQQRRLTFRNLASSAKSESSGLISCSIKAEKKAAASHWLLSLASAGGKRGRNRFKNTSPPAAAPKQPSCLCQVRLKVSYRRLHAVVALPPVKPSFSFDSFLQWRKRKLPKWPVVLLKWARSLKKEKDDQNNKELWVSTEQLPNLAR